MSSMIDSNGLKRTGGYTTADSVAPYSLIRRHRFLPGGVATPTSTSTPIFPIGFPYHRR